MCNYIPVRNWLTTLSIVVGAAISSAMLAIGFAWSPWFLVGFICFGAAATWCGLAALLGYFAFNALEAYCKCAAESGSTGCSQTCEKVKIALGILMFSMIAGAMFCTILSFMPLTITYTVELALVFAAASAALVAMLGYMTSLANCQSAPPLPPAGLGTNPVE